MSLYCLALVCLFLATSRADVNLIPEVAAPKLPPCKPFVKHSNGTYYKITIGRYLDSVGLVPCHQTVEPALKFLFRNTSESAKLREELKEMTGLCGQFVDVVSYLARTNRSYAFCNANSLTHSALTRDFCREVSLDGSNVESAKSTLNAKNFTAFSTVLTQLYDIARGDGCTQKCGGENSQILCNGIYSLIGVVSEVWSAQPKVQQPINTTKTPPSPVTATNSSSPPIVHLLGPLSAVPLSTLRELIFSDEEHLLLKMRALLSLWPRAQLDSFLSRGDIRTVVRVFWVARLVHDELSAISLDRLNAITDFNNLLYMKSLGPSERADIDSFEDKELVLRYMHTFRSVLFDVGRRQQGALTPPPQEKGVGEPPADLSANGEGGLPAELPDGAGDIPSVPPDGPPGGLPPTGPPGGVPAGPPGNPPAVLPSGLPAAIPKAAPLPTALPDGLPPAASENEPGIPAGPPGGPPGGPNPLPPAVQQPNAPESFNFQGPPAAVPGLDDPDYIPSWEDDGEPPGLSDVGIDILPGVDGDQDSMVPQGPSNGEGAAGGENQSQGGGGGGGDGGDVGGNAGGGDVGGNAAGGYVPLSPSKPKTKETDEEKEKGSSRGYGPFHFLGLFLVVVAVAVVGYLCMHNRKKLREGVNGYMSGSGKRRRTRNYKPLATSET